MSIEEIINVIDRLADGAEACSIAHMEPEAEQKIHENSAKALREAIALLKTHPDAQPNEPLTIKQIMERVGKPVWAINVPNGESGWRIIDDWDAFGCSFEYPGGRKSWCYYNSEALHFKGKDGKEIYLPGYWLLYDRPPKGET